uniref:K Homology domain-containing protein n=2 Tax=Parascaris univalens TaxID=6257 RepID=A0A915C254_PARUN
MSERLGPMAAAGERGDVFVSNDEHSFHIEEISTTRRRQSLATANSFSILPNDQKRYLDELLKDMRMLCSVEVNYTRGFRHTQALLAAEIDRVWNTIYEANRNVEQTPIGSHIYESSQSEGTTVTLQRKIAIPRRPGCKYVGRILGPRGISIRQLEADTDCRILIRGKGSVKDSRREARLKNKTGWEHLSEPLHVLITASESSQQRCAAKLERAAETIEQLLATDNDEYKRVQLVQLAIINGTYRPGGTQRRF